MKAKMSHVIKEDLSQRPQLMVRRRESTQEINKMAFKKRENVDKKQVGKQKSAQSSTSAPVDVLSQYLLHEEEEFTLDKNVPSCMFSYNCCQEVTENGLNALQIIFEKKGGKSRTGFKTKVWAPTRSATREM